MNIRAAFNVAQLVILGALAACSAGGTGGGSSSSSGPSAFSFIQPTAGIQVHDNNRETLKLKWTSNGSPVVGQSVKVSTNQGNLIDDNDANSQLAPSVTPKTQSNGEIDVDILATSTGAAKVTATATDPATGASLSTTLALIFVGEAATVTVTAASPIVVTDTDTVTVTVKDAQQNALANIPVTLSLKNGGGSLSKSSDTTNTSGTVSVTFTPDTNSSVLAVIVQASASPAPMGSFTINVTPANGAPPAGTFSFSSCPTTVSSDTTVSCTVNLMGPNGTGGIAGIANASVNLAASLGSVKTSPVTTDANGNAVFSYQASTASNTTLTGTDSLTATWASTGTPSQTITSNPYSITIQPLEFEFTQPVAIAPATTVNITEGVRQTLMFTWLSNNTGVAGPVTVSTTTAGSVLFDGNGNPTTSPVTVTTGSDGVASVDFESNTPGPASVTATATDTVVPSATLTATPLALTVLGLPSVINVTEVTPIQPTSPGNQSLITATVTDSAPTPNPLPGVPVTFSFPPGKPSGGTLSTTSQTTDANGRVTSQFTSDGTAGSFTVLVDAPPATEEPATIVVGNAPSSGDTLSFLNCPPIIPTGVTPTVPTGGTVPCTISLLDSSGVGVSGASVTVKALLGSVVATGASAAQSITLTTVSDGTAPFTYQALTSAGVPILPGPEVLSATVTPTGQSEVLSNPFDIVVPAGNFDFNAPKSSVQEEPTNELQPVSVSWGVESGNNNEPIGNQNVILSTTLGQFYDANNNPLSSPTTVSTGAETGVTPNIYILSRTTGAATLTATATDTTSGVSFSTTQAFAFVGPAPSGSSFSVSAEPSELTGGGQVGTVSAIVVDGAGTPIPDVSVNFSSPAGEGTLSQSSAVTDSTGTASVLFTPSYTVTKVAVQITVLPLPSQSVSFVTNNGQPLAGTLSFSSCPITVPSGDTATCTLTLLDGNGAGINSTAVTVTATLGTVAATAGVSATQSTMITTGNDGTGTATFLYYAATPAGVPVQPGNGDLSAKATVSGATIESDSYALTVAGEFAFTAPTSGVNLTTNVPQSVSLKWASNFEQPVTLSATGGGISFYDSTGKLLAGSPTPTVPTDSQGNVSVKIIATATGAATLNATATDQNSGASLSTSLSVNFDGQPPLGSTFQAAANPSALSFSEGEVSTISAIVDDGTGNPLSNIQVGFVVLPPGGGTLAQPSAVTDGTGTASVVFTPDNSAASVTVQVSVPPLTAQNVTITVSH